MVRYYHLGEMNLNLLSKTDRHWKFDDVCLASKFTHVAFAWWCVPVAMSLSFPIQARSSYWRCLLIGVLLFEFFLSITVTVGSWCHQEWWSCRNWDFESKHLEMCGLCSCVTATMAKQSCFYQIMSFVVEWTSQNRIKSQQGMQLVLKKI